MSDLPEHQLESYRTTHRGVHTATRRPSPLVSGLRSPQRRVGGDTRNRNENPDILIPCLQVGRVLFRLLANQLPVLPGHSGNDTPNRHKAPSAKRCIKTGDVADEEAAPADGVIKHRARNGALRPDAAFLNRCIDRQSHKAPSANQCIKTAHRPCTRCRSAHQGYKAPSSKRCIKTRPFRRYRRGQSGSASYSIERQTAH